jgi:DNA-binding NtrC family response regulator
MRADDLDHEELLDLDPEGGVIRFAGQRALLLDAVAMGLLRKYLVENFGLTAARGKVRRLDEVEKDYILAALEANGGNQTHTAAQLRIGAATLYRKLKSYGLIGPKRAPRERR